MQHRGDACLLDRAVRAPRDGAAAMNVLTANARLQANSPPATGARRRVL